METDDNEGKKGTKKRTFIWLPRYINHKNIFFSAERQKIKNTTLCFLNYNNNINELIKAQKTVLKNDQINIAQTKSLFRPIRVRAFISHEPLACLVYTSCTYPHPLYRLVKSRCYTSYLVPRRGESALSRALMKATF